MDNKRVCGDEEQIKEYDYAYITGKGTNTFAT